MSTLRDVAEKANVSVSTVSKFINDVIDLKPETEARIVEAIHELGYKRSFVPKKNKMEKTIAMILPELTSIKFAQLVNFTIEEVSRRDYTIMVFTNKNSAKMESRIVSQIIQMGVTAAIFVKEPFGSGTLDNVKAVEDAGIPTISINRVFDETRLDTVNSDYYNAMKDCIYHFYSLGISDIGLVLGWKDQAGNKEILRAVRDVSKELEITTNIEENIFYSDFNELKYQLAFEYFSRRGVKAAFLISDVIVAPMYLSIQERGLVPQKDFKLVSLSDNTNLEVLKVPGLDIDAHLIAKEAIDSILNRLENRPYDKHKIIRGYLRVH